MQEDLPAFSISHGLPRMGEALKQQREREALFRKLALRSGFAEINLALASPFDRFKSLLTGETMLANGPRFTDARGQEMALRSDMTAFAIDFLFEHGSEVDFPARVSYSAKVFRADGSEAFEYGAELVGASGIDSDLEVLSFACECARVLGYQDLTIVVGDAGVAQGLHSAIESLSTPQRATLLPRLREALAAVDLRALQDILDTAQGWQSLRHAVARSPVASFLHEASRLGRNLQWQFNPWLVRPRSFYSGLMFDIYAQDACGRLAWIGGGGRYDGYASHFGRELPAVGCMLRDPGFSPQGREHAKIPVRIALPKGRLLERALSAFAQVGIHPVTSPDSTRQLRIASACGRYEFLFVKNADLAAYIEQGMADIAIAGSDVLDEHPSSQDICRPVTFAFGSCRICLAGKPEKKDRIYNGKKAKIATKYGTLATETLARRGISCDLIPLQGSVELAAVIGFADAIVDLVETGVTLRENGLVAYEELARTRVQLAARPGFVYGHLSLWRSWLRTWSEQGLLAGQHAQAGRGDEL